MSDLRIFSGCGEFAVVVVVVAVLVCVFDCVFVIVSCFLLFFLVVLGAGCNSSPLTLAVFPVVNLRHLVVWFALKGSCQTLSSN